MEEMANHRRNGSWLFEGQNEADTFPNFSLDFLLTLTIWLPSIALWSHVVILCVRYYKDTTKKRRASFSSNSDDSSMSFADYETKSLVVRWKTSLPDSKATTTTTPSLRYEGPPQPWHRRKLLLCFCSGATDLLFALLLNKSTGRTDDARLNLTFTYLSLTLACLTRFLVLYLTHASTLSSVPRNITSSSSSSTPSSTSSSSSSSSSSSLRLILFLYWFLLTLIHTIPLQREVEIMIYGRAADRIDGGPSTWSPRRTTRVYLFCATILSTLNFLIHGWAPRKKTPPPPPPPPPRNSAPFASSFSSSSARSPFSAACYFSRLTFFWFAKTVIGGYRKELVATDLDEIPRSLRSSEIDAKFETAWKEKREEMTERRDEAARRRNSEKKEIFRKNENFGAIAGKNERDESAESSDFAPVSASLTMIRCYSAQIAGLLLLDSLRIALELAKPIMLGWLLNHIDGREKVREIGEGLAALNRGDNESFYKNVTTNGSVNIDYNNDNNNDNNDDDRFIYRGLVLTFFLVLATCLDFLVRWLYLWNGYNVGLRVKTGLVSAIYNKFLNLDPDVKRRECASGELMNMMVGDAPRFVEVCYLLEIVVMPLELLSYIWLLTRQLGWGFVAGLAFLCLLMPVNWFSSKKLAKYHKRQMSLKDARVKLLHEVFNGIKAVKLHVWEAFFAEKIGAIREKEIVNQKRILLVEALVTFLADAAPILVGAISFSVFALISSSSSSSSSSPLTAEVVFVSLALFDKLRRRMAWLLKIVVNWSRLLISKRRIDKFMTWSERTFDPNVATVDDDVVVSVQNGKFSWDENGDAVLSDLSFDLKRGTVHSIIGPVGAGKSSILLALLGEMRRQEGKLTVRGSVAYVSQHPWLKNASVRDNILFGNEFDAEKYERIVDACALRQDIDSFPAGDATEIGVGGVNLSGGQRLRISLARAVYADADVYLLDDPLSAVDAQVGNHIFDRVLGPSGLLSSKTRLIVTGSVNYLRSMNSIIALRKGRITEMGSYSDLMANKNDVARLVKRYSCETNNDRDMESCHDNVERKAAETSPKLTEEESNERGSVKRHVWTTYFGATGWFVCFVGILSVISVRAFEATAAIYIAKWTDKASKTKRVDDIECGGATHSLQNGMAIYDILCGLASLSVIGVALCHLVGSIFAARHFHQRLTKRVLSFPMSFFETVPLGRIINRFSNDISAIDRNLHNSFYDFISKCVGFLATMVVIGVSEPRILLLLPLLSLYFFLLQKVYKPATRQMRRIHDSSKSLILSHFSETIQGIETIRAFGVESKFQNDFRNLLDGNTRAEFASHTSTAWIAICIHFFSVAVLVGCCVLSILGEGNTSGMAGLAITSAFVICAHLGETIKRFTDLEKDLIAVERVDEYLKMDAEEDEDEDAFGKTKTVPRYVPVKKHVVITNLGNDVHGRHTHILAPAIVDPRNPLFHLPSRASSIVFREFSAHYRKNSKLVLNKVNLTISAGEKVGVVGRTGSGKSSLTMALLRVLDPSEGTILIDGMPIDSFAREDLRSTISFIPQDPVIFSETLRFNLDPLNRYSDEEIERVVDEAHLNELVDSFHPEGLNRKFREAGEDLSIGQRQLLCLGRAMLKRSRIVVLDEATASVDPRTNQLIQDAVDRVFRRDRRSTIILISHRLQDVLDCDKIVVMQRGVVAECGRPSDLLRRGNNDGAEGGGGGGGGAGGQFRALAREAGIV